ncbi:type I phosphomannose isomerase catalytic subunit [Exiguobacterium sp. S22-S28]|uniref:type I phosphomannose isomerase catalytic subunit n=1 Tax=Exiguobacterium sp. S22-S28 TaxID=3342768 RepID=UPI00372D8060
MRVHVQKGNVSGLVADERHLFGVYTGSMFSLLIKILDAADDFSVQVHPDKTARSCAI